MIIGVVGVSTMGGGIAQDAAAHGHEVRLASHSPESAQKGLRNALRAGFRNRSKGTFSHLEASLIHNNVTAVESLRDLKGADLVFDCVPEVEEIKEGVFIELGVVFPEGVRIVSMTSSLSINKLATYVVDPSRFIGGHFFNPVPQNDLLEIIAGDRTSDETIEVVEKLGTQLGKKIVRCPDIPGFFGNRIGFNAMWISLKTVEQTLRIKPTWNRERVQRDCDTAMKVGFKWEMGPIELADLVGLDVVAEIFVNLELPIPESLAALLSAGNLGRKTGRGFYSY